MRSNDSHATFQEAFGIHGRIAAFGRHHLHGCMLYCLVASIDDRRGFRSCGNVQSVLTLLIPHPRVKNLTRRSDNVLIRTTVSIACDDLSFVYFRTSLQGGNSPQLKMSCSVFRFFDAANVRSGCFGPSTMKSADHLRSRLPPTPAHAPPPFSRPGSGDAGRVFCLYGLPPWPETYRPFVC